MHYYKKNLGDYYTKTGRLSMLQHGAYTLLMDACYDRERFPNEEEAIEWCWAFSEEEIQAVKFVLKRFFTLQEDGTYIQQRIADEIEEYRSMADKNQKIAIEREAKKRENRKNAANPRAQKRTSTHEEVSETLENQDVTCESVNETSTSGARTVHEPCKSVNLTNNQEPRTINHSNTPLPPTRGKKGFDASLIELPDWLNPSDWSAWVADRKQRKKPITERAAALQIKQLADYRQQGYSPHEVIQNSIAGGYQGLFPPSKTKSNVQTTQEWGREMTRVCEVNIRNAFEQEIQPAIGVIDATSN